MLIVRLVAVVIACTLCAAPASAGDFAERHIFGFSPDGSHFAFEEYGVQDGSGFPYSNIYIVDVANDSWLPGTPLRVRIDDESAGCDMPGNKVISREGFTIARYQLERRGN